MKDVDSDAVQCNEAAGAAGVSEPSDVASPGSREQERVVPGPALAALSQELQEAQAEVRRLRSFLSHGLRQPLAALTIWAELLNAKQSSSLDEQGRRYLRELTASVHRIAGMLSSEVQGISSHGPEGAQSSAMPAKPAPPEPNPTES